MSEPLHWGSHNFVVIPAEIQQPVHHMTNHILCGDRVNEKSNREAR